MNPIFDRNQAANCIKARLESVATEEFKVRIWEEAGRIRLYIKDLGYRNYSAQDQGWLGINTDGSLNWDNIKRNSGVVKHIRNAVKDFEIAADPNAQRELEESKASYRNRPNQAQTSHHQSQDYCFGAMDEESF